MKRGDTASRPRSKSEIPETHSPYEHQLTRFLSTEVTRFIRLRRLARAHLSSRPSPLLRSLRLLQFARRWRASCKHRRPQRLPKSVRLLLSGPRSRYLSSTSALCRARCLPLCTTNARSRLRSATRHSPSFSRTSRSRTSRHRLGHLRHSRASYLQSKCRRRGTLRFRLLSCNACSRRNR